MRNNYPHGSCPSRSATPTEKCPLVTLRAPLGQEMGSSPRNDQGGGRSYELRRAGKVGNNGCSWGLWGGSVRNALGGVKLSASVLLTEPKGYRQALIVVVELPNEGSSRTQILSLLTLLTACGCS